MSSEEFISKFIMRAREGREKSGIIFDTPKKNNDDFGLTTAIKSFAGLFGPSKTPVNWIMLSSANQISNHLSSFNLMIDNNFSISYPPTYKYSIHWLFLIHKNLLGSQETRGWDYVPWQEVGWYIEREAPFL